MKIVLAVTFLFATFTTAANAGTDCTTRKSGSVTITTCSSSKHTSFSQCRSYMSGRVRKTSCR